MTAAFLLLPFLALVPAFIARQKNQGFWTYYVFGLLLWIVAVPVALLIKDKRRHCPFCIEAIDDDARACPHCRRALDAVVISPA
ncbi:MAG: hypothetical protein M3P18_23935 [Actinomycetota bacterium]|nr:hypothetical protein [Actinomycetota bacterium]